MTILKGRFLVTISFIFFLIISGFLLYFLIPESPTIEMELARAKLSSAHKMGADIYAGGIYSDAKFHYDSAMIVWHEENNKLLWLRNYARVEELAMLSAVKSDQSVTKSGELYNLMKNRFIQKKDSLDALILKITVLFHGYPLAYEDHRRISQGKFILKEAEIEFSKDHLFKALIKIQDAEYMLKGSYTNATENLLDYFESYQVWKVWFQKAVLNSKTKKEYSIIVDKFSHKCFVFYSGKIKYEFDVELGKSWVGNKLVRGDKATPEGMYKIVKKMDAGKTNFYKALLLDYPNSDDRERFKSAIKDGIIPASSDIGNMIEIHGNGGKGTDWTNGCIALKDKDMDLVYKISKVGTQVTIVGSIFSLEEVYKKYLQ